MLMQTCQKRHSGVKPSFTMGEVLYLCSMKVDNIKTYFWLVDLLLDAGKKGLMLTQIQQKYREDMGSEEYQRRTFINHRKDIREIFGIDIECRFSDRRYYIANDNPMKDISRFRSWMYDAVSATLLSEKMCAMSDRIMVPHIEGAELVSELVDAIAGHKKVDVYLKSRQIEGFRPYGLCQKRRKWILAGAEDVDTVYDIDLGEVVNLVVTSRTFYPNKEWNAKEHFSKKEKKEFNIFG